MYFIQSLNYSQQKYTFEFKYIKDIRCCHVMSVFNCKTHTHARARWYTNVATVYCFLVTIVLPFNQQNH